MDDFNFNTTYSSGWKRIKREDDPIPMVHTVKQIPANTLPFSSKKAVLNTSTSPTPTFEEKQKEIIDKINNLQNEMDILKQLLDNIRDNTEMLKALDRKNVSGSKLSRFFK